MRVIRWNQPRFEKSAGIFLESEPVDKMDLDPRRVPAGQDRFKSLLQVVLGIALDRDQVGLFPGTRYQPECGSYHSAYWIYDLS